MRVVIRGQDQLVAPVHDADGIVTTEIYSGGKLLAIFTESLVSNRLVLVTAADDDWQETLERLGYTKELKDVSSS